MVFFAFVAGAMKIFAFITKRQPLLLTAIGTVGGRRNGLFSPTKDRRNLLVKREISLRDLEAAAAVAARFLHGGSVPPHTYKMAAQTG